MVAPLLPTVSSVLSRPYPTLVEQPMEKLLPTPSQLIFPNEFPYEFDSLTFPTPQVDSTETEDETSDDEDNFLAGLTRRLALSTQRLPYSSFITEKPEVKPKVSESTQSGLGSPNGPFSQMPSPPTSPFREEDSLKVISAAAGEVAKIKMANFESKPTSRPDQNPNSLLPLPQNAAFYDYYYWLWQPQYHQSQTRFGSTLQQSPGRVPITWLPSPSPARGILTAPTAVKSPSVGTGVFLPRIYSNPSDSKKKSGGGSVKIPTKVVHKQNPKVKEFSGRCKPNSQACVSTGRSKIVAGGSCLKQ
ncbi:hypothetical protein V5N11_034259 [Cardamine amara subsp. amara]|uniref:Uncharacterized protein n=1 Tax=Cardamine amara subsp. amara TaxID=228776 RepID=A0ABD1APB1_CARAN